MGNGAESGQDAVPLARGRGQDADHVGPDGITAEPAAVAHPLPVPCLGAGATARLGERRMVPAVPTGVGLEVVEDGGAEVEAAGLGEAEGLAPAVGGVADSLAVGRLRDGRGAGRVAQAGPLLGSRDLVL